MAFGDFLPASGPEVGIQHGNDFYFTGCMGEDVVDRGDKEAFVAGGDNH
jgi:hypothetical protein